MAEDVVFRKLSLQREFKRIHVIDALADERPFGKEVLIHVGYSASIGINAGVTSIQSGIPRTVRTRHTHGNPWLQDPVALHYTLLVLVVARTIQRVGHRSHKLPCRISRQLRISVECDHELYVREDSSLADNQREVSGWVPAQQCIQIAKLAPLAFVPHPSLFAGIPKAWAMKQKKRVGVRPRIFFIQLLDSQPGKLQQRFILGE